MQLVDRRNAATLLPIIQQHVHPGTVVISDEWAAYSQISSASYSHSSINHSLHFFDPITGRAVASTIQVVRLRKSGREERRIKINRTLRRIFFEISQFLFLQPVFLCIITCTIHIIVSD